ncbi:hypothetical protein DERP_011181 [Dermatophagoides pteronyssinus]|uniref:Uncharacterized protein n=1 Tax=Dermatophagoides pteronyssinus TaxID=6956 RepID=A0ABQ8JCI5_DERPT|nr:hypothetical protein DERP_011181 [Dermatophagoides pteronyssinus]
MVMQGQIFLGNTGYTFLFNASHSDHWIALLKTPVAYLIL